MGALIDSSVFIAAERRRLDLDALLRSGSEPAAMSAITASELLVGLHRAIPEHTAARREFIERLLGLVPVLPLDLSVARVHAPLSAELARSGTPVGHHDLIIAATALAGGHSVITRDQRSFPRIPGVVVTVV